MPCFFSLYCITTPTQYLAGVYAEMRYGQMRVILHRHRLISVVPADIFHDTLWW